MNVKICGVTLIPDAVLSVELGATLLGLNFWPGSPRAISLAHGRQLADEVRGRVQLVGVFVDQSIDLVRRAIDEVGLDLVQLHGDEDPVAAAPLLKRTIKAFRSGGVSPLAAGKGGAAGTTAALTPADVAPWSRAWGVLFDAAAPGAYGGTGTPWDWGRVAPLAAGRRALLAGGVAPGRIARLVDSWRQHHRKGSQAPLLLRGQSGLGPLGKKDDALDATVAAALPWGIDVASGVERSPGVKDPALLRQLFEEVRDVEVGTHA